MTLKNLSGDRRCLQQMLTCDYSSVTIDVPTVRPWLSMLQPN